MVLIKDGTINHEAEMWLVKIPLERLNESLGQKEKIFLEANLHIPQNSGGIVLFVHGSGSGFTPWTMWKMPFQFCISARVRTKVW